MAVSLVDSPNIFSDDGGGRGGGAGRGQAV